LDYLESIQYEFKIKELAKRIPSLTYSSIHWALSGSNSVDMKHKEQPKSLLQMGIFTNYSEKYPKFRYEPLVLVHVPKPDTLLLANSNNNDSNPNITSIPNYPDTVYVPTRPVVHPPEPAPYPLGLTYLMSSMIRCLRR
jgi:hypothetical protein